MPIAQAVDTDLHADTRLLLLRLPNALSNLRQDYRFPHLFSPVRMHGRGAAGYGQEELHRTFMKY